MEAIGPVITSNLRVLKESPLSHGLGFRADGTQALFYIGNRCGVLCGAGWYVVMEKREGRWVILKEIETRISWRCEGNIR